MNAIEYARKFVYFWQNTPISGPFDEKRYPIIIKPLLALDNIICKCQVVYGPTQSLKSVLLQIAIAYRMDIYRKSGLAISQTDDDAKEFSQVKLRPFLERIYSLTETVRNIRNPITDSHWLWAMHELIVSGPGSNAQNSKSCPYLFTDEAHLWDVFYPEAFLALEGRMGERWDRAGLHATTAADAGTEIDARYHMGRQNEWNNYCIHCHKLFRPLWGDHSKEIYNGHKVFVWKESQSESEQLDSIEIRCPHCDKPIKGTPRNRRDIDENGDYVPENPGANPMYDSFRWNAFAIRWKTYKDLFAVYLNALKAAKIGDLTKYAEWVKKYEVRTWTGEFPALGSSHKNRDYKKTDIEVVSENRIWTGSIDRQEGEKGAGFHLWASVEEWERDGKSKRIDYRQLPTWSDATKFIQDKGVSSNHVGVDFGNQVGRDVFGICAENKWYAMKSTDEEEFSHAIRVVGGQNTYVMLPYSETRLENAMSGKSVGKNVRVRSGAIPDGHCLSILWSKPKIYPILYALKNGDSDRYYGIASDIGETYIDQVHSYIPSDDMDKKQNIVRKVLWKKVAKQDHAFICSAQSLVIAIRAGFFPLS